MEQVNRVLQSKRNANLRICSIRKISQISGSRHLKECKVIMIAKAPQPMVVPMVCTQGGSAPLETRSSIKQTSLTATPHLSAQVRFRLQNLRLRVGSPLPKLHQSRNVPLRQHHRLEHLSILHLLRQTALRTLFRNRQYYHRS